MTAPIPGIRPGSQVSLHISISLPDGTVALSTFDEKPLQLVIGDGTLTSGLEQLLLGLKRGDERTLTLEADQAYGPRDENNVHFIPLADFPEEMELAEGVVVAFTTPSGAATAGTIRQLDESQALVDFNHPLAGRELLVHTRILAVS